MKASASKYCHCLYFASNALARKVEKLAVESWKKADLSPSHAYLLMLVNEKPGLQPTTLSEQLMLTPSTITRLIEKLEEKQLVTRRTEGKLTNVFPTPKGIALQPLLEECAREFCVIYSTVLGGEESQRMVQNMVKIADKLQF